MTWQVENTIPYVNDGTSEDQETAALKYFFDTFLPSKGWTVSFRDGEDATSRYRIFQRNFTDVFTGNPDKHYLWVDIVGRVQYEDATYTTTPGDLGTNARNQVAFNWHTGTSEWTQHSYKFWGSTENSKAFIVTRWDHVLAWDLGNDWPTYRPNADQSQGPSIDRWESCIFLPMRNGTMNPRLVSSNLPTYSNTSTSEATGIMGPIEPKECPGGQNGFFDTVEFITTVYGARAVAKAADVKWFNYQSNSLQSVKDTSANMTTFIVVQVNGGDYWLFTKGSKVVSSIALNIGPTVPDFE